MKRWFLSSVFNECNSRLMEAETVNYNISSVYHSFIISLKAAAVGFYTMLGSAASPWGSKLLSTFNSHLPATLL